MKKIFIFILAIGFCLAGFQSLGQVSQGTQSAGLTFSWEDRDIVGERNNTVDNFRISPSYAYFIKDKLSIIGEVSYYKRNTGSSYSDQSLNGLAFEYEIKEVDVFMGLRRYIEVQPKLFLTGTYGLNYHWNETYVEQMQQGDRSNSLQTARNVGLFGNLGLAYFPHEKFSFELIFLDARFFRIYNKRRFYNESNTTKYQGWGFELAGFLNQPSLGLRYFF
ncbi:hypothetical protein [Cyclobacterium plantarum]|uniref:hypothetical protein n=1 Tax=Cyclobacterium plantarum TaxID=2716263 RepID=UPI003F6F0EB0